MFEPFGMATCGHDKECELARLYQLDRVVVLFAERGESPMNEAERAMVEAFYARKMELANELWKDRVPVKKEDK
jgi:hypothetical protein